MTSESMSFVVVILFELGYFTPWTGGIFDSSPPPDGSPGEPPYDQDHVGGEPTTREG